MDNVNRTQNTKATQQLMFEQLLDIPIYERMTPKNVGDLHDRLTTFP